METDKVHAAFKQFATGVKQKLTPPVVGEPEDQLRGPMEQLLMAIGEMSGKNVIPKGEIRLGGGAGKPDYGVTINGVLAGFLELKAPGKGADARHFKGHDKAQFEKFSDLPNLLYSDGNEWILYRRGERYDDARFSRDIGTYGARAVKKEDVHALQRVFSQFLFWQPQMPASFKDLAAALAPLCRFLRNDIVEAIRISQSKLIQLAKDWRKLLFPEASDERFADAYAQTVTFALLLARLDGADVEDLNSAVTTLKSHHTLLSRALQILTDDDAIEEIEPAVRLLQRTLKALQPQLSTGHDDPWLYFYEDFLAAYDEKLRKDYGVYYTPVQVVRCQVRLIDELLRVQLKKNLGFGSPGVITLDPAVGTGTYPLGVIDHVLKNIERKQGPGAVAAHASNLAKNLHAFEFMVGPFAVAELRISRALADRNATLPKQGLPIYLTDTLESPNAQVMDLPHFLQPISDQHKKALEVKKRIPVLVCFGNPPYDRHAAAIAENHGGSGNWVRHGDSGGAAAILNDFIEPARAAGLGVHIKNLYNLYVYFWRWALWKVFERSGESGAGVVSFITASSYLSGPGFAGMRSHLRKVCDAIWIIDLGGEGRGADADENVFNIQTPVAIGIAFRRGKPEEKKPAEVRYVRIRGTRNEKLDQLNGMASFKDLTWETCPAGWLDKFMPISQGNYAEWPKIVDLFPWQHSGVQLKRTWPIAPSESTLEKRWKTMISAHNRAEMLKETDARKAKGTYMPLFDGDDVAPIENLSLQSPSPRITRYAYRSFDRQCIIADQRVADRPRAQLWATHSHKQCYFSSLLTAPIGRGPAIMSCADIPDLHHFRGSFGAKDNIPFYRDRECDIPNVTDGIIEQLEMTYGKSVVVEDLFAYCYGAVAHPGFSAQFKEHQKRDGLRVPVTRDAVLFWKATAIGRKLIWLHTYGERFAPKGKAPGEVPPGMARCLVAVSDSPKKYPEEYKYDSLAAQLHVGEGVFAPVSGEVWEFEVSGLKVLNSWLGYRMKERKGRKSSPLDDIHPERWTAEFTTELLNLLWILEATLEQYPEQEALFAKILSGPLFFSTDFSSPPDWMRKPPQLDGPQMAIDL